jgi:hypothetical protein
MPPHVLVALSVHRELSVGVRKSEKVAMGHQ